MPVVKGVKKLCHFAHIPKCAGRSVEKYCESAGLKIGFLDVGYIANPALQPWNLSSPQHIDGRSLARLFPADFFDFGFAVVRHPASRFISAFKYNSLVGRKHLLGRDVNHFVENDLRTAAYTSGVLDNHFLPQCQFLMPDLDYEVFKLELGLSRVKLFIDHRFSLSGHVEMGHENQGRKQCDGTDLAINLSSSSMKIIEDVYDDDYRKFDYRKESAKSEAGFWSLFSTRGSKDA